MKFENLLCEIILENVELGEVRALTKDEFVSKAHDKHDAKRINRGRKPYEYENVNYVDTNTKVDIICPEHGPFPQRPYLHLRGQGCDKCALEDAKLIKKTTDEFIQQSKNVHDTERIKKGRKPYEYENVIYMGDKTIVNITCPEEDGIYGKHGDFPQKPNYHLRRRRGRSSSASGCPKCAKVYKKTTDEFIQQAKNVHDEKRKMNKKTPYDYSEVEYVRGSDDVIIICHEKNSKGKEHGPFLKTPNNHLYLNQGCPICNELKGETNIKLILGKNNIEFIPQYRYEDCVSFKKSDKNKRCKVLRFDFYLPKFNTLIEFDGRFHFDKHYKDTNDNFMSNVINDREKNSFTKLKGIKLIRISYFDINNLEEEIRNGLISKEQLYLSKNYGKHKTGWVDDNFQPTTKFLKTYNNVD